MVNNKSTVFMTELILGLRVRQQATTKMNADSSRSHAIFTITVEVSKHLEGRDQITMAKLNFVDLAGSERQTKTGERFLGARSPATYRAAQ